MTKKSVADRTTRIKRAAKEGKIVFPKHAVLPKRKPENPIAVTHVSIVGFDNRDNPKMMGRGKTGFSLQWGTAEHGFGEITFFRDGEKIVCDTECMGEDFVEKVFKFLMAKTDIR